MIVALPDKPWQVALIDQDKGNMIDVKVHLSTLPPTSGTYHWCHQLITMLCVFRTKSSYVQFLSGAGLAPKMVGMASTHPLGAVLTS